MWLLGIANPLEYPLESLLTLSGIVLTGILTWLTTKGYDAWQRSRRDKIKNQALEDENKQKRTLAELNVKEREAEIRLKEERGEFDLEALRDNKVIKSYQYLLEKERVEKDALRSEHKEEIATMVAEMRQMRDEHKKEMAISRADHEQCLQDRATGIARIQALEERVETLSARYEALKRRVGGSDAIIDLAHGKSTELAPSKAEKESKPE